MKGCAIPYSAEELAWIEERRAWPRSVLHETFAMLFERPDVSLVHLNSLCKRKGWMTGRTGCFAAGEKPWNTGLHYSPPGSEKGWFKKGNLPHTTKFLGHERVSKDGYVEVSIAETNPHTGFERRYVLKHVHEWEAANGPVPEGHCLKCLDGDKTNTDPLNWECIPRALLPRLNGGRHKKRLAFDAAEPEVKPTLLTIAKVEHRTQELRRKKAGAA